MLHTYRGSRLQMLVAVVLYVFAWIRLHHQFDPWFIYSCQNEYLYLFIYSLISDSYMIKRSWSWWINSPVDPSRLPPPIGVQNRITPSLYVLSSLYWINQLTAEPSAPYYSVPHPTPHSNDLSHNNGLNQWNLKGQNQTDTLTLAPPAGVSQSWLPRRRPATQPRMTSANSLQSTVVCWDCGERGQRELSLKNLGRIDERGLCGKTTQINSWHVHDQNFDHDHDQKFLKIFL